MPSGDLVGVWPISSGINWSVADAAPYRVLNEVLWKDAKGPGSAMPAPKVSAEGVSQGSSRQADGDDE